MIHTKKATDLFPPYSEEEIASKLTQVFDIYVDLCYIPKKDVVYPPKDTTTNISRRHDFSPNARKLFSDVSFGAETISLLERIPYIHEEPSDIYNVYPNDSRFYCFTDEDCFRTALDSFDGVGGEPVLLEPMEFALVTPSNRDGDMLILNVGENSIRRFNYINVPDGEGPLLVPETESHYKNYPPTPAPAFLQGWIDDLRNLKFITYIDAGGCRSFMYAPPQPEDAGDDEEARQMCEARLREPTDDDRQYYKLKIILERTYGWSDAFENAKWARDCERVSGTVQAGYVPPQEATDS